MPLETLALASAAPMALAALVWLVPALCGNEARLLGQLARDLSDVTARAPATA